MGLGKVTTVRSFLLQMDRKSDESREIREKDRLSDVCPPPPKFTVQGELSVCKRRGNGQQSLEEGAPTINHIHCALGHRTPLRSQRRGAFSPAHHLAPNCWSLKGPHSPREQCSPEGSRAPARGDLGEPPMHSHLRSEGGIRALAGVRWGGVSRYWGTAGGAGQGGCRNRREVQAGPASHP